MRIIKSIFLIINYKTFIVTILAVLSTMLCRYYGLQANFPLTIVGIAIVFPVVFSIDSAYKRRERTLMLISDFKAHINAIYLASRDWIEPKDMQLEKEIKSHLMAIYYALRNYCSSSGKIKTSEEDEIYKKMSELSELLQRFRGLGVHLGEFSRVSQYFSKLAIDIENIKVIRQYRTPITLRAYSRVFIYSFPIIYGPYFAYTAHEYSSGLEFFMPVIFSFILVSLDNIQEHLEDPFDQVGEDDVKFDVEDFEKRLESGNSTKVELPD